MNSIASIIRDHAKISQENAQKLQELIIEACFKPQLGVEIELAKKPLLKEICDLQAQLDLLKSESLDDKIRRITKEVVADEVKANLTISEDNDPYSGRRDPCWTLQWGGQEI